MKMPRALYILFVLSLVAKLLAGFYLNTYSGLEEFEYETIANNILSGNGFLYNFYGADYKAFVQPFYPVFTAFVYYFTNHSQVMMLIVQSVISSLFCFIIYSIAIKIASRKEAILAAALVALHPGICIYSILKLHTLILDIFFYLLTINFILAFIYHPGKKNAVLTGLSAGLALLSRSTILPFVLFSMVYSFFVIRKIPVKTKLKYLTILFITMVIVYSPWLIRNYITFDKFVFAQTSSGENLWVGNNDRAVGTAYQSSGRSIHHLMPQKMRTELSNLSELERVKYYEQYFINFVKEKPLLFTQLFFRKFYYFWWFAPHTGALYNTKWVYAYKMYYTVIFFMFLIGFISFARDRKKAGTVLLLAIYMLSLSLLHALVNVDTRHRWTVEPIMLIFTSIGIFKLWNIFSSFSRLKTNGRRSLV